MGNRWNHAVCAPCYGVLEPGRDPVRLRDEFRAEETCCRCGRMTTDGIYYRADPEKMNCKGQHGEIPVLGTVS